MRKFYFLCLLASLILFQSEGYAQPSFYAGYEFTSGVPRGFEKIVPTADAGYAILSSGNETSVSKFDPNFNQEWTYAYDSLIGSRDMTETWDNKLLAMFASSYSGGSLFLVKLDLNGNEIWQKEIYVNSTFMSAVKIMKAHDSGYLILGGNCIGENLLIHIDENGDEVWAYDYPDITESGTASLYDGVLIPGNGYMFCSTNRAVSFYRVGNNGDLLSHTHYSYGTGQEYPNHMRMKSDGTVIVAGRYDNGSVHYLWLMEADTTGNINWMRSIYSSGYENISDFFLTDGDSIICAANYNTQGSQGVEFGILKVKPDGVSDWGKYGGSSLSYGSDFIQDLEDLGDDFLYVGLSSTDNNVIGRLSRGATGFCNSGTLQLTNINLLGQYSSTNDMAIKSPLNLNYRDPQYPRQSVVFTSTVFCGAIPVAQELPINTDLHIWPQPANESLNFDLPAVIAGNPGNLKLRDLSGKIVLEKKLDGNQSQELNLEGLKAGVYFLELASGEIRLTQKVLLINP